MSEDIIVVSGSNSEKVSDSAFDKLASRLGSSSLDDIYDKLTWIQYLFDISGSMNKQISRYSEVGKFEWAGFSLDAPRQLLLKMQESENADDRSEQEEIFEDAPPPLDYDASNDDDLRRAIVDQVLNVPMPPLKKDAEARSKQTKIQIAKSCAKTFLEKRFEKYPDARVGVSKFGGSTKEIVAGQDKNTTIAVLTSDPSLDYANGGGTNMHGALTHTLNKVKKARGSAHHFILVTDGEATDGYGKSFLDKAPDFEARKVVLDVIFLRDRRERQADKNNDYRSESVKQLEALAIRTGGSVEYVDNEEDFSTKFLAVSNRKLPQHRKVIKI